MKAAIEALEASRTKGNASKREEAQNTNRRPLNGLAQWRIGITKKGVNQKSLKRRLDIFLGKVDFGIQKMVFFLLCLKMNFICKFSILGFFAFHLKFLYDNNCLLEFILFIFPLLIAMFWFIGLSPFQEPALPWSEF